MGKPYFDKKSMKNGVEIIYNKDPKVTKTFSVSVGTILFLSVIIFIYIMIILF